MAEAYSAEGSAAQSSTPCKRPLVKIAITLVGSSFGEAAVSTLRSLLRHATCPVHAFVVADAAAWAAFEAAVAGLPVAATLVDLHRSRRYAEIYGALPTQCHDPEAATGGDAASRRPLRSKAVFHALAARLFLHEILPAVDRIISLDVGDLLVLSDICRLWSYFDWFHPTQALGAAWEVGAPQVPIGVQTGDEGAAKFWAARGVPQISKGINSGVLLLDLQRMRTLDVNGSSWTAAMVASARHSSDHWCGLESIWDQAILNAFLFRGVGHRHLYELSSRWNYIPGTPWELAFNDAQASGLPPEALGRKLHSGLRPGGRLLHWCPSYADIVGDWLMVQDLSDEQSLWLRNAKEYHLWFTAYGAPGFYTGDTKCGSEVWIVHFAGHSKRQPWARELLHFWASGPPK
mmetsp:Transcript_52380/g.169987  ORF Transcript_52380/g.169987 Transcript_52380/m.169987 type:complete len:404 (+) Transcript_52380:309-1520(+)